MVLISPDEALDQVLAAAAPLPPVMLRLDAALGLVLAETIPADRDYPPFDRSMMDGYAVRLADAGRAVPVIGVIAAGGVDDRLLVDGQAIEIMTGAPCPAGTEAVVPKEEVARSDRRPAKGIAPQADATVTLPGSILSGQHIARTGCECRAGRVVLQVGAPITPLAVAVLASIGRNAIRVVRRPRIAIVTTGDELARGEATSEPAPKPGQIRDSNGPMLTALARAAGLTDLSTGHAGDTADALRGALADATDAEIVVLSGGVSAGRYDLVPQAIEELGAGRIFHKVNQRPGKPLYFAVRDGRLFFGLPGNPLSCHVCFHRYIRPAARKMLGLAPLAPLRSGRLARPFVARGPRVVFQLARAAWDAGRSEWLLSPLTGQGSADIFAPAAANALVRFDPREAPYGLDEAVPFEELIGCSLS